MVVALTWDLLIIVFFALVVTYSLIIGRHEAVKVLVASHIAAFAAQGIGMGIMEGSAAATPILQTLGLAIGPTTMVTVKLLAFVGLLVAIAIHGGLSSEYEEASMLDTAVAAGLGMATAAFLLLNLLAILGDSSPVLHFAESPLLAPLFTQSLIATQLMALQALWLVLPAILLIGTSFL